MENIFDGQNPEKVIENTPKEKMSELFSKMALGFSEEEIDTVSFCFWLLYMAETDLNDSIQEAWGLITENIPEEYKVEILSGLQQYIKGKDELDPEKLEYFRHKIALYEGLIGKNSLSKFYWKLNDLRNDLFHNRIKSLSYNERSLFDPDVKKELAKDYFNISLAELDLTQSPIYNSLTEEERTLAEQQINILKERL